MAELKANGLKMPHAFPAVEYDFLTDHAEARRGGHPNIGELAAAMNGVAHRYRATESYVQDFQRLFKRGGAAPTALVRAAQEKALFGLFCSGVSTVECVFYGLYALGTLAGGTTFKLATEKDRRQVSPRSTQTAFMSDFPTDAVIGQIDLVLQDAAYGDCTHARNTLTHRAAPARHHYVTISEGVPAGPHTVAQSQPSRWGDLNFPLTSALATDAMTSFERVTGLLLKAAWDFAQRNI